MPAIFFQGFYQRASVVKIKFFIDNSCLMSEKSFMVVLLLMCCTVADGCCPVSLVFCCCCFKVKAKNIYHSLKLQRVKQQRKKFI